MYIALSLVAGFLVGGIMFLLVGITIGRNVGSGEDHFLPPLPRK